MKQNELIIKKKFECSKRELFDAWSDPLLMAQWFYARPVKFQNSTVKSNFNKTGRYDLTMHFEGGEVHIFGTYQEILRYTRIEFTWNSPMATDSIICLDFKELSPNRTQLTLTQTLFPSEESRNAHATGWNFCLENLELFIDQGFIENGTALPNTDHIEDCQ